MKFTNKPKLILLGIGMMGLLLLTGCGQPQPNLSQVHTTTKEVNGRYYTVPYGQNIASIGVDKLGAKWVLDYINYATGNTMQCNKRDLFVTTKKGHSKINHLTKVGKKFDKKYPTIRSPKQIYATPEGREYGEGFKNLANAREIACAKPWSSSKVAKYKKQQRIAKQKQAKINSDPRVVAARIQANAMREQTQAQTRAYKKLLRRQKAAESSRSADELYNMMVPKTYNVNVRHYGY